jgi:class 3 adenylate cyclase
MATRIKVIMFTDCVAASHNKTKIGDAPSIELLRTLERFTRDIAAENGGRLIKSLGDGHLLTFDSALRAIRAGLDLQKRVGEYTTNYKLQRPLLLRVGIDVGDVHVDADGDVFGHYVDMAKRVECAGNDLKLPVLFTERVCAILPPKSVEWRKLRPVKFKGSPEPIALYQATGVVSPRALPRQRLSSYLTGASFQVLLRTFSLKRDRSNGLWLRLNLEKDIEVITTGAQKQEFFREIAKNLSAQDKLTSELNDFMRNGIAKTFDCAKWPLRYANGGALPIVSINGIRYACLFYRDVFPIGWNIANGASDSYAELYFPNRIIKREFGEEFVVADHDNGILKFYEPGPENISPGYQTAVITALASEFKAFDYSKYGRRHLAPDVIDGPDKVTVSVDEDAQNSDRIFLSITPSDNAIEVDQVVHLTLDSGDCIIDGEIIDGIPLDRIVGLFRLENLSRHLNGRNFKPDLFFVGGQPGNPEAFQEALQKSVRNIQQHRRRDQTEFYHICSEKYDLCPVTRALLTRFLGSLEEKSIKLPDAS